MSSRTVSRTVVGKLHRYCMEELTCLSLDLSVPDGKVCLNEKGELAVTKFAVEPVRDSSCLDRLIYASYANKPSHLGLVSSGRG